VRWIHEEACARAILLASMEVDISVSLCGLSTSLNVGSPFFSCLYLEFEVVRSHLLTRRPRPTLDEAMLELHADGTHLRAGGMGGAPQSSFLVVRAPLLSTAPPQPPLAPSTKPQCGYCGKYCHTKDVCRKKQHDKKTCRGESSAARSVATLEQEVLMLVRDLYAVAPSPSVTTARASVTPPPPPPLGISSK